MAPLSIIFNKPNKSPSLSNASKVKLTDYHCGKRVCAVCTTKMKKMRRESHTKNVSDERLGDMRRCPNTNGRSVVSKCMVRGAVSLPFYTNPDGH